MKTTYHLTLSLLSAAFCASPTFAQVAVRCQADQSLTTPFISARSVRKIMGPKGATAKRFVYTGDAALVLADCRTTANRISAYYYKDRLTRIVAQGHVTLIRKGTLTKTKFKATGETAAYSPVEDVINLKGKVELSVLDVDMPNTHVEDVAYDIGNGTITYSLSQENYTISDKYY